MSYLTYNGKMIQSNHKYLIGSSGPLPLTELFSFKTIGTNIYNTQIDSLDGISVLPGDNLTWNMGDTSTSVSGYHSLINHTYSGGYVYPADKTVRASMYNPSHADFVDLGNNLDPNSHIYEVNLSNWPSLKSFSMGSNDISTLSFSSNTNLESIFIAKSILPSINIQNNLNLITIQVLDSSRFKTIDFHNSSNYPGLYWMNLPDNSMNSTDVSNFIDNVYTHRTQFTYPNGWGMVLSGRNASINTVSAQKIVRMEKYNGAATWASGYNVINGIMRNYFSTGYSNSNISSYFLQQTDFGINKSDFYGNTYTTADSSLVITFRYELDTSISNFQASNITWNFVTKYKRDTGDALTTLDNTNFVCTSNTSGMTFQKDVSLYLSHVLGTKQFGIQFQITLTDNRANKNQVAGDNMVIRVTPMLNDNPINEGILIGGNETWDSFYSNFIRDFTRTKWGA